MVANFAAQNLIWLYTELSTMVTMSLHNKQAVEEHGRENVEQHPKNVEAKRQAVEGAKIILSMGDNLLAIMKSRHIENALNRLRRWPDSDDKRWDELFTALCGVRDSIRIECGEYLFYAYPKSRGEKLRTWKADWGTICEAFPDVEVDTFCATDCYALGHATASVFHSMRVAEVGLRAIAKERRIKLAKNKSVDWACWQEIIKALDDEIKTIGLKWRAGSRKDAALEFYSGARADLNGFKDEYRNLVMHVREAYDEHQAARALSRVHDFMSRLAQKIDHKHHRISWGKA